MANIFQTTKYPTSFLEGTFGDKFYQNVVEPFKTGQGAKPTLGQVAKNWNPFKAFTPQMLATGPTRAASTFLKSTGIGTLASMLLNPTVANADEVEWEKQLMRNISMRDKRATQKGIAQVAMQKRIQEAERQKAAAAQAQAAAVQQVRQNIQTYGSGDRPNVGINRPGGGRGQSPTGGDVAGTPFYRGGLASLYG